MFVINIHSVVSVFELELVIKFIYFSTFGVRQYLDPKHSFLKWKYLWIIKAAQSVTSRQMEYSRFFMYTSIKVMQVCLITTLKARRYKRKKKLLFCKSNYFT
jgi:hypothetical protein